MNLGMERYASSRESQKTGAPRISAVMARRLPPAFRDAVGAAGLSLAANQWEMVDDFDWLKSTHSPHWCTLPESERRVDFAKMSVFAGAEAGGEVEAEVEAGGEVQPVS